MRSKVIDSARDLGLDLNVRRVPESAATLADKAACVGCGAEQITSCVVYVADGDPIVCIAAADCLVDPDLLADALDVAELRLASPSEIRAATGFSASSIPPFGHSLPIVLDDALLGHATVWAMGGDGRTLVELEPVRLADCTSATVAAVAAVTA